MRKINRKEFEQKYTELLKELVDFFDEQSITYALAYGTLLGAYRDKKMIEWDVDIDLYINDNDLNKIINKTFKDCFLQTYKKNELRFYLSRIVSKRLFYSFDGGVTLNPCHIDLFSFVGLKDENKTKRKVRSIRRLVRWYEIKTWKHQSRNGFIGFFKPIISSFLPSFKRINKRGLNICNKLVGGNEILGGYSFVRYLPFSDIDSELEFGDYKFKVFNNHKEYLELVFGPDYMTPKKDPRFDIDKIEYFILP